MEYPYFLVDVFTTAPLEGNALAVFPDASGLDKEQMQRIARELNLSETTFVFPAESAEGATRVRIFTPTYEMKFAGHPTIGTAFVLRESGLVDRAAPALFLDENIGRVPVRVDERDDLLWLTTPPIRKIAELPREHCAASLSLGDADLVPDIPCELLSAGNPTIFVPLRSRDVVDRVSVNVPAFEALARNCDEPVCLFPFAPVETGAYSRMFSPELGIVEDPATGSATGPLAKFMMTHGLAPRTNGSRFVSEQGVKMGRRSLLHILVHGEDGVDGIEVGGTVTPVGRGTLTFPSEDSPNG